MAKILDYISLSVIILLVTFVWSTLAFGNWIVSLIFSIALTIAAIFTVKYVKSKKNKPYTYDRLAFEFAMRGSEYIVQIFKSIIKNDEFESGSNYILLKNSIIVFAYRFNLLSINDICSICSLANKHEKNTVFLLTKGIDRRAYQVVQMQSIKLKILKIKTVYKFLYKHNALPDLKPIKTNFSLKWLAQVIFNRVNTKSYIFSGAILIGVSFLTPLKIYYIVLGTISLMFALLTLTPLGNGLFTSPKVFEEFEYAINNRQVPTIDNLTTENKTESDNNTSVTNNIKEPSETADISDKTDSSDNSENGND